jgi:lysophospholipase L1-like esterase
VKQPIAIFFLLVFTLPAIAQEPWENAMQAFEAQDKANTYPAESIFMTGSSTIVLWRTAARDLAPYPVINRGFGGSNMGDVLRLADRYMAHHTYRAVIVFVANDITGGGNDKTPEQVRDGFRDFILKTRGYNADAPIFIVAITPVQSRWAVWHNSRTANNLLARLADEHTNVVFIPTEDLFLGADGKPIPDLFVSDQLHLSEAGYARFSKRVRGYVEAVLR